jgi:hypothetical protein
MLAQERAWRISKREELAVTNRYWSNRNDKRPEPDLLGKEVRGEAEARILMHSFSLFTTSTYTLF